MNKQREALQVALDTLRGWIGIDEWIWPVTAKETCKKNSLEAITAIREALAEPEKTNQCGETCERAKLCAICASGVSNNEPLTDEEIGNLELPPNGCTMRELVRAIERAHGIGE